MVRFFVSEAKKLTLTSLSGPKHARAVAFYNCYKRRHIVAIWIGLVQLFILKGMERAGEGQHDDIQDDDVVVQVSFLRETVIEA